MKSLLLLLLLSSGVYAQSEKNTIQSNISEELLSHRTRDQIVQELVTRLYPKGVSTDDCIMNMVSKVKLNDQKIKKLVDTQQADGSWNNIDYKSKQRSSWPPHTHHSHLLSMAQAYGDPQHPLYKNKNLSQAIHRGMQFWYDQKLIAPNWWHNEIGVPKTFSSVMILMQPELSEQEFKQGIEVLNKTKLGRTGQNKVWQAGIVFTKAVLLNDEELLKKSSAEILSECLVTTNEGVQLDWSFHQHGPQQQFGNYGLAYTDSMAYWASILQGSSYDFSKEQKIILRNYLLKGINKTIWKGYMDVSACGRQIFKNAQEGKAGSLIQTMDNMTKGDPEYKSSYEAFIQRNYIDKKNELTGHTHFWRSDYSIHRTPDAMISVKMCSQRVIGGETTNNENLLGFHLADGATFTYVNGDEYKNIMPVWDWRKIPGVTSEQSAAPLPTINNKNGNKADFVGGLEDGTQGIAAMDFDRAGITGRKAWFFLNNQVFCLGANLTSQKGTPFATTIEQSLSRGTVTQGNNPSWVHHANIGYTLLTPGKWIMRNETQTGDWHSVAQFCPSQAESEKVFTLYMDHTPGQSANYAYALYPAITVQELEKRAKTPDCQILENNKDQQAMKTRSGNIIMAAFYSAGTLTVPNSGTISVSHPCLLLIQKEKKETKLVVSDPTHRQTKLEVTLTGKLGSAGQSPTTKTIELPQKGLAGSSVTIKFP